MYLPIPERGKMINLDPYIIEFISGNWITMTLALGMLKIVAKLTPGVLDDSIVTLLSGIFGMVRGNGFKNGKSSKDIALND